MPTETKRRGILRWRGIVKVEGRTVATKWFGQGERERRKAILWEEAEKKRIREESKKPQTRTESLTMGNWATAYLNDVQRRCTKKTYDKKRGAFRRLAELCGNCEITELTPSRALAFLQRRYDSKSGYAANKDRQNLGTAWEWGRKFIDGFPNLMNPFTAVQRFKEKRQPRYVPSEEDFDKVLAIAEGQDKVMLTTFINLAARRGEVFGLKWSDVDFGEGVIRLTTGKTRDGSVRSDYLPMSKELKQALIQWWQDRPIPSEYVFSMLDNAYAANRSPGDPFTSRCHFMRKICQRAGVKPFDFHSIRHLSATLLYKAGENVSMIQKILRHQNPTTTNRYLASLGFQIEEMRKSVEALARGPAEVIHLPKKVEAL
jgi:integrase